MFDAPKLLLWLLAGGFFTVAGVIVAVQRKAKTCAVHSRSAGRAALVLGVACAALGIGIIVLSLVT